MQLISNLAALKEWKLKLYDTKTRTLLTCLKMLLLHTKFLLAKESDLLTRNDHPLPQHTLSSPVNRAALSEVDEAPTLLGSILPLPLKFHSHSTSIT